MLLGILGVAVTAEILRLPTDAYGIRRQSVFGGAVSNSYLNSKQVF